MSDDLTRLIYGALMPGVDAPELEPWVGEAIASGVETVCLFGEAVGSPEITRRTNGALRSLSSNLLIALDEESGDVTRVEALRGSSFLAPLALGAIDDVEVTRASARLVGALLRDVGIDWTLAPVGDINVDPANPVIGVRSFGSDAETVSAHAAAFIEGLQSQGVLACAKHFPGHGDTSVDSHEALPVLTVDLRTLDERELAPFRSAIAAGVASIMTGHLLVPSLDPQAAASASAAITAGLLRGQLGFEGVVITDAIEMGAVSGPNRDRIGEAAVSALLAGADVVCIGAADQEAALGTCADAIRTAVDVGVIGRDVLRAAADRRERMRSSRPSLAEATDSRADTQTLAAAAARSLAVVGDPRLTHGAVDVVRIAADPGYAAGEAGWGVAEHLDALGWVVRSVDASRIGDDDRDLVIETRDPWKSPEIMANLRDALSRRPDGVVVDVGWPTDSRPDARAWIRTRGASRLSSALAACILTGTDPVPPAESIVSATYLEIP